MVSLENLCYNTSCCKSFLKKQKKRAISYVSDKTYLFLQSVRKYLIHSYGNGAKLVSPETEYASCLKRYRTT